jgi:hypothetical protein
MVNQVYRSPNHSIQVTVKNDPGDRAWIECNGITCYKVEKEECTCKGFYKNPNCKLHGRNKHD